MGFLSRLFGWSSESEEEESVESPEEEPAKSQAEGHFFRIPWRAEGRAGECELKDPRILLSDIRGITASNVAPIRQLCRKVGHPLVLLTPEVDQSVIQLLGEGDLVVIRATDLPGQSLCDLFDDVAVITAGTFLCNELGFGLSFPATLLPIAKGGICIPSFAWEDVNLEMLGRVKRFLVNADGIEFRGMAGHKQAIHAYSTAILREEPTPGRDERLRRLWTAAGGIPDDAEKAAEAPSELPEAYPLRSASRYFITEPKTGECRLKNAYVAVFNEPLEDLEVLVRMLGQIAKTGRSILIVAPSVSDEALAICVVNKLRGILSCAVAVPVAPSQDTGKVLAEIASRTNAKAIRLSRADPKRGDNLLASLGTVKSLRLTRTGLTF